MNKNNKLINITSYINGKFLDNTANIEKILNPENNQEIAAYTSISTYELTQTYKDAAKAFES
ncbi:hypothetical protein IKS57_04795 [bacterium]|nr:hypothetical protein [bacterium]